MGEDQHGVGWPRTAMNSGLCLVVAAMALAAETARYAYSAGGSGNGGSSPGKIQPSNS